ncbi:hypothetical protein ACFX2I_042861 [Malus domestica]
MFPHFPHHINHHHQLPLARIKKIMKADEDVRVIFSEAPVLFAKACDFFIPELTIRSWLHAEESKRQALQKMTLPLPLPAPTYSISWWILYPGTRSRKRQWVSEICSRRR